MARRITTRDREALLATFSFEARVAYVAFCAERCLAEARRHPRALTQLAHEPQLLEGVELLWTVARGAGPVEASRVAGVRELVGDFERPHPGGEMVTYARDLALVAVARVLVKGMRVIADPSLATPAYVVGVLDGPAVLIASIYEDAMTSRRHEVAVIDVALDRLRQSGPPIARSLFDGIPEWPRGAVNRSYADGRLTDSSVDE